MNNYLCNINLIYKQSSQGTFDFFLFLFLLLISGSVAFDGVGFPVRSRTFIRAGDRIGSPFVGFSTESCLLLFFVSVSDIFFFRYVQGLSLSLRFLMKMVDIMGIETNLASSSYLSQFSVYISSWRLFVHRIESPISTPLCSFFRITFLCDIFKSFF